MFRTALCFALALLLVLLLFGCTKDFLPTKGIAGEWEALAEADPPAAGTEYWAYVFMFTFDEVVDGVVTGKAQNTKIHEDDHTWYMDGAIVDLEGTMTELGAIGFRITYTETDYLDFEGTVLGDSLQGTWYYTTETDLWGNWTAERK